MNFLLIIFFPRIFRETARGEGRPLNSSLRKHVINGAREPISYPTHSPSMEILFFDAFRKCRRQLPPSYQSLRSVFPSHSRESSCGLVVPLMRRRAGEEADGRDDACLHEWRSLYACSDFDVDRDCTGSTRQGGCCSEERHAFLTRRHQASAAADDRNRV